MKVVPGSIYNQVSIDCNASSDKELSDKFTEMCWKPLIFPIVFKS